MTYRDEDYYRSKHGDEYQDKYRHAPKSYWDKREREEEERQQREREREKQLERDRQNEPYRLAREAEERRQQELALEQSSQRVAAYLQQYKTGELFHYIKDQCNHLSWGQILKDISLAKEKKLKLDLPSESILQLHLIENYVKNYQMLSSQQNDFIFVVSDLTQLADFNALLKQPEFNRKTFLKLQFESAIDEKSDAKILVETFSRVQEISINDCTVTETFSQYLNAAKEKAGINYSVKKVIISKVKTTPEVLQAMTGLAPRDTLSISMDEKGYYSANTETKDLPHSQLSLHSSVVSKDFSTLLDMLPAGRPKHIEISNNAYHEGMVLADDGLVQLKISNSRLLASHFKDGGFARQLQSLKNLSHLIFEDITFALSENKKDFLAAIFQKKSTITRLEINDCQLNDSELPLLLEFIKTNKTLTSLDLRGNHFSTAGIQQLAEVICDHNLYLKEILIEKPPLLLTQVVERNTKAKELQVCYEKVLHPLKAAQQFQVPKEIKEIMTPADLVKQLHEIEKEFVEGYTLAQRLFNSYYPNSKDATLQKELYDNYLPELFNKYMAVAVLQTDPNLVKVCHVSAINFLIDHSLTEKTVADILKKYLSSDVNQLLATKSQDARTIFSKLHHRQITTKHPELAYLNFLALLQTLFFDKDDREIIKNISETIDWCFHKLKGNYEDKAWNAVFEKLMAAKSSRIADFALSTARKQMRNIKAAYINFLRKSYSELFIPGGYTVNDAINFAKETAGRLKEIGTNDSFEGHEHIKMECCAIIISIAQDCLKERPRLGCLDQQRKEPPINFEQEEELIKLLCVVLKNGSHHDIALTLAANIFRQQIYRAMIDDLPKESQMNMAKLELNAASVFGTDRLSLYKNMSVASTPEQLHGLLHTYCTEKLATKVRHWNLVKKLSLIRDRIAIVISHIPKANIDLKSMPSASAPLLDDLVDDKESTPPAYNPEFISSSYRALVQHAPLGQPLSEVKVERKEEAYNAIRNKLSELAKLDPKEKYKAALTPDHHDLQCAASGDGEIMRDPVKGPDGFTYERSFIQKWIDRELASKTMVTSPIAGTAFSEFTLTPDLEAQKKITLFIQGQINQFDKDQTLRDASLAVGFGGFATPIKQSKSTSSPDEHEKFIELDEAEERSSVPKQKQQIVII